MHPLSPPGSATATVQTSRINDTIKKNHTPSTKDLRHYIGVHQIYQSSSPVFGLILPAVHTYTGCDTTSSFFKIGPEICLDYIKDFSQKNEEEDISAARKPTGNLYDAKAKLINLHYNHNHFCTQIENNI